MAIRTLLAVAGLEGTSDAFKAELVRMAEREKLDPDHVATVMSFETGATFDPTVRNAASGATGLIQFTKDTAKRLGTTTDKLAELTAIEQLPWVAQYFRTVRHPTTLEDHYLAVFAPSAMHMPINAPVYSSPSKSYEQNRNLDADGDGVISVRDATTPVRVRRQAALQRPRLMFEIADTPTPAEVSSGSSAGEWLAVVGMGLAIYRLGKYGRMAA